MVSKVCSMGREDGVRTYILAYCTYTYVLPVRHVPKVCTVRMYKYILFARD